MDGSSVAKLKKFSKVAPNPKDEDVNGDQGDDEANDEVPIEESNELAIENISEEDGKGESPQGQTSLTQDVKGSAKNRRRRKKKRKSESSQAEKSPEKSLTEDVKSPAKKRKMNESECSQVETSPEKSVTEGVESPKKKRKRRKKKKAMVTENSETSEVLTSPNSESTSDKSSMQVKEKAKKRKLEQTHTDNGASPTKERRLSPSGLTRAQKKRRNRQRNKQKLAEGGQELTVTASGKVPSAVQEKPSQNRIAKENQSSAISTDKLASKKAKRQKKKKKLGIVSEKPNGDGSVQPLDTSVEPDVVPSEKKKKKRRKKKLANGSVAETTGNSVPQREWESGDVGHSATSEESQVSKESKPQVKAANMKGNLPRKRVTVIRSAANKRLGKEKKTIVSVALGDKPVRLLIAN